VFAKTQDETVSHIARWEIVSIKEMFLGLDLTGMLRGGGCAAYAAKTLADINYWEPAVNITVNSLLLLFEAPG
jgi:hypothetical protein